jgi:hypothetical protein
MLQTLSAIWVLYFAINGAAYAACSAETAMNKSSDVADVLSGKLQSNPDASSKLMAEMGDIAGNSTISEQTCVKLDDLMVRAKKL